MARERAALVHSARLYGPAPRDRRVGRVAGVRGGHPAHLAGSLPIAPLRNRAPRADARVEVPEVVLLDSASVRDRIDRGDSLSSAPLGRGHPRGVRADDPGVLVGTQDRAIVGAGTHEARDLARRTRNGGARFRAPPRFGLRRAEIYDASITTMVAIIVVTPTLAIFEQTKSGVPVGEPPMCFRFDLR